MGDEAGPAEGAGSGLDGLTLLLVGGQWPVRHVTVEGCGCGVGNEDGDEMKRGQEEDEEEEAECAMGWWWAWP